jgi:hypothetical protein
MIGLMDGLDFTPLILTALILDSVLPHRLKQVVCFGLFKRQLITISNLDTEISPQK